MGTLYIDTGGALTNSGSSDQNLADLSGSNATVSGAVVTLDGAPDLSGLSASGANQASIYLDQATNAGQKVFWITAVDNTAKTVTVDVAPTGITGSTWAIGGRAVLSGNVTGALRPGDTLIINNSPANSGTSTTLSVPSGNASGGYVKVKGKAGVRPVLSNTSNATVGLGNYCWLENVELSNSAKTNGVLSMGSNCVVYNVTVTDSGTNGITPGANCLIIGCDIGSGGIYTLSSLHFIAYGNYIHDSYRGITMGGSSSSAWILNNIFDSQTNDPAIYFTRSDITAVMIWVVGNTIYSGARNGLSIVGSAALLRIFNNIFLSDHASGTTYNVDLPNEAGSFHAFNVLHNLGIGANVNGLTIGGQIAGSETSADPLLVNPVAGDFTPGTGSPALEAAIAAGFTT